MTELSNLPGSQSAEADDEISLLDLLIVLAKYKILIVGLPILVATIAAGYSLLIPNIFTAETRILPPQGQAGALAQQLSGLAALAGGGAAGIKNPSDLYVGMLKSRTVADNLIQHFGLMEVYASKLPSQIRQRLAGVTRIAAGREGIITIEVDDADPKRAAELANAYVDELFKLTKVLAVTEASQRRLFFEHQFEQARDNLAKAENATRKALDNGGLVQVEGQGRAILETTARLRGQITVKEVQIGAMRAFATDRNPDLQFAQKEVAAMKQKLASIEGTSGGRVESPQENDGLGNDSLRLLRSVKYYETIYELLAKQFELSKIDEAKDSSVVQVMDKAIEPDVKSKPKRTLIVLVSALVAGIVAIMCAFARVAMLNIANDPQHASRLKTLRRYLVTR